jgi:phosphatidylserine decarboxylase
VARDGIPYILIPLIMALLLTAGAWFTGLTLLYLAGAFLLFIATFMAYFFRDPERQILAEPGLIVSPADGKVTRVQPLSPEQANSPIVVSIFLSPLDVHINRAPIAGIIKDVAYTKGKFLMATKEDSSLLNEQNAITIEGEQMTIVCKQIAGILARRIVCWKKRGDTLTRGERFGLIKFSSRTDLILPPNVAVEVIVGTRVQGGSSIIGRLR